MALHATQDWSVQPRNSSTIKLAAYFYFTCALSFLLKKLNEKLTTRQSHKEAVCNFMYFPRNVKNLGIIITQQCVYVCVIYLL